MSVVMDLFVKGKRAVMGDCVRQSCWELVQCAGEIRAAWETESSGDA